MDTPSENDIRAAHYASAFQADAIRAAAEYYARRPDGAFDTLWGNALQAITDPIAYGRIGPEELIVRTMQAWNLPFSLALIRLMESQALPPDTHLPASFVARHVVGMD